jgi:hypothetical protein
MNVVIHNDEGGKSVPFSLVVFESIGNECALFRCQSILILVQTPRNEVYACALSPVGKLSPVDMKVFGHEVGIANDELTEIINLGS